MQAISGVGKGQRTDPAWGAVMAMALCVAVLIASEFLPVSLLTPIAADLALREGQAGQVIGISGLFAVLTSLCAATVTQDIDRRRVLTVFTAILVISGLVVSLAAEAAMLMVGRALLGVAIGGFWSMSTSVVMRLLPERDLPRGLALLNAGNAIAATLSAPLGSLLGDLIGWRGAFFLLVVPPGLVALLWQAARLPALPPVARPTNPARLLGRPRVAVGMAAIFLLFMGQFALFTYVRPFLETVPGFSAPQLSAAFLGLGLAGITGTWWISRALAHRFHALLIGLPLALAIIAVLLVCFGGNGPVTLSLLIGWGFVGTAAPVAWGTWLSRTLREEAEAGGGLQVAVIQLAITAGAATGGALFDRAGWDSAFLVAALLLAGSSLCAAVSWRMTRLSWRQP